MEATEDHQLGPGDTAGDAAAGQRATVDASVSFATALYGEAARGEGNLFLAPASVFMALVMTYAGARGETAGEMARALRLPELDPSRLHAMHGALAVGLEGAPGIELAGASAVFGQKNGGFLPAFVALLAEHYRVGLREVDFESDAERARTTINRWVEQATKGKIADLVPFGIVTTLTRLVLVSAIAFKGAWAACFDEKDTIKECFFRLTDNFVLMPLMHRMGHYKLAAVDDAHLLEMPYEGGALAMVIVLPDKKKGLLDVEAKLGARLRAWLGVLDQINGETPCEVEVTLPRFRIEASLRLDEPLKHLGMRRAFDPNAADFSGMNGRQHDLHIAAALHKAFVDVNEQGTTAAAATAVVVATRSRPIPPLRFRADHPFLFLVRDLCTGSILFLGRLVDPS